MNKSNIIKIVLLICILIDTFVLMRIIHDAKDANNIDVTIISEPKSESQRENIQISITPDEKRVSDLANTNVFQNKNYMHIILVGQDRRHSQGKQIQTRADTIMLCSINKVTNEIYLTSFMRDMYVDIPGHGKDKINASYAYGGIELLTDTMKENFDITTNGCIEVDFDGFLALAEILEPLSIDLSEKEATYMIENALGGEKLDAPMDWDLKEGRNDLNKKQLLKYVRMRHVGNADYERTQRQRKFLKAALEKAKKEDVTTLIKLVNSCTKYIRTDLSTKDMLGLVWTVLENNMDVTKNLRIPVDGSFTSQRVGNMSVLVPDKEKNKQALYEFLFVREDI